MPEASPEQLQALVDLLASDWLPHGTLTTFKTLGDRLALDAYAAWKAVHDLSLRSDLCHLPWHRIVGVDGILNHGFPKDFMSEILAEGHMIEPRSKSRHKVVPFVDHHAQNTPPTPRTETTQPPRSPVVVREMTPEEIATKYPPVVMRDSDDIDSVPWD